MIATEKSGRGANRHRGRSAFLDVRAEAAMQRLLELGNVRATRHTCLIRGTSVHYLKSGAGPTMLLLHGAGGGAANWYRLMGALSHDYQLIAPDLPGFGLSDTIEPQAPLGRQMAQVMADLLANIGAKPDYIVGTSFGGLTAMRLAELIPFKKMILIDPAGLWPDASVALKLICLPGLQRLGIKQSKRGARWALRHVLMSKRLPREHEDALTDYVFSTAARTDVRVLARGYSLFGGLRGQAEVATHDEMQRWSPRTLIIWGGDDRFLPASRRRRAAALAAGARLRIIPGVGHSPNWEAPDEVLQLMNDFFGARDETRE